VDTYEIFGVGGSSWGSAAAGTSISRPLRRHFAVAL